MSKKTKKADQYNDPNHNYLKYWNNRDYEHQAEVLAIHRLLGTKHFKRAVDIGGGYGRLSVILDEFADRVTLVEPSSQQLDIATNYLKGHGRVDMKLMQADDLQFEDGSVDLAVMVRVMHHLIDPSVEFKEVHRILAENGYFILEVANYTHARNRLRHSLQLKKFPKEPVDIRSKKNKTKDEIIFVNHNPRTVIKQLAHSGLKVERILSVSNLRSPSLKKVVPSSVMLAIEGILQPTLAKTYFGPSVFFLIKKAT